MESSLALWAPRALSILRIVAALLFIEHGTQKLFAFPVPAGGPGGMSALIMLAAAIEIVGGLLVLVGLFTRYAAFLMSGEMAVAYFLAHAPRSPWPVVNMGEAAILFCFVFLYLVFAGGGAWSVDALRRREPAGRLSMA